MVFYFDDDVHY